MKNFRFYPTLDEDLLEMLEIEIDGYTFHYITDKEYKIKVDVDEEMIVLFDEKGIWDATRDNLIIKSKMTINHPTAFFENGGIAVSNAKVGVGIRWYSSGSKLRGFEKIGTFDYNTDKFESDFLLKFERKTLRSSLVLEPIFYIDEPGLVEQRQESNLANIKGVVIGELLSTNIILEGERSEFPVVEVKDANRPLWELVANFATGDESFNDTVYLTINSEHRDYKYIDKSHKDFSAIFLEEIMINVVSFLVDKGIREDIIQFDSEDRSPLGSVSYVLNHWVQIYDLKDEAIVDIHRKVNKKIRG